MSRTVFIFFSTLLFFTVSSGCIKLGPMFHEPELGIQIPEQYDNAVLNAGIPGDQENWWEDFNDSDLNRIVDEVLANNYDIKKAAGRILEIRSQFVQTRADRFPDLGIQGQAQRLRQTGAASGSGEQGVRKNMDSYGLSLPASFEVDLWGRLALAEEAVRNELLQAEENQRTVAQTVVAEAINLYLQIESLERQIQIAESSVESFSRSLSLVKSRYVRGLVSTLDLRQARRTLAGAEAVVPVLRQELGVAQQALAVLMGHYPVTRPPRSQPEDYFKRLSPVPVDLPSDLLLRRPDVRSAEAGLRALNAFVGVAKASRFPRINLTGSFGYASEDLDRLLKADSELWSLAAGIVQPLFDAGKLEAAQKAAEARYDQAVADYAKTVLAAFAEVESALLARKEQLERRDRVLQFLIEARATQDTAESRYRRGLVDYLAVLDAQQTRFQAEQDLVLVDFAILSNRVALYRALGGGWGFPEATVKSGMETH